MGFGLDDNDVPHNCESACEVGRRPDGEYLMTLMLKAQAAVAAILRESETGPPDTDFKTACLTGMDREIVRNAVAALRDAQRHLSGLMGELLIVCPVTLVVQPKGGA